MVKDEMNGIDFRLKVKIKGKNCRSEHVTKFDSKCWGRVSQSWRRASGKSS